MARRVSLIGSSLLAVIVATTAGTPLLAEVVIGDWENAADGWIDWGTQATIAAPKYGYSTFGATRGTTALKVTTPGGYNQNLAIKLHLNGFADDFFENQQFEIDFSVPETTDASGYSQIFGLALNAEGYGFIEQGTNPKFTYGFPNGGPQTTTITWSYAPLVDGDPSNGEISRTAGYIEFILATNSDVARDLYFDNARLTEIPNLGDFNLSGTLDPEDIDMLLAAEEGEVPFVNGIYDVNGDQQVRPTPGVAGSDADYWVQTLAGTRYGDTNIDRNVNFADLVSLAQNYGTTTGATWADGSFNNDGAVNFADLVILAQNYGFSNPAEMAALAASNLGFAADWALAQSLVPEPTSLAALALLACGVRRRRR